MLHVPIVMDDAIMLLAKDMRGRNGTHLRPGLTVLLISHGEGQGPIRDQMKSNHEEPQEIRRVEPTKMKFQLIQLGRRIKSPREVIEG